MNRRRSTMKVGARALCVLGSLTLAACTELGSKARDEGPLLAEGQPLAELAEPVEPAPPRITDCPDGWERELVRDEPRCVPTWEVEAPDFSTCPAGWKSATWGTLAETDVCVPEAPTDCPPGERSDMASGQCVLVGTACPAAGSWAAPPAGATSVRYVRPGGSGSGTQASPYGTLDAAIAAAPDGATILLAAGEYVTTARIDDSLTIVGACATGTSIVGTAAPVPEGDEGELFEGALHVHGSGNLRLSNVTLSGPRIPLTVKAGGTARVEEVIVEDFTPFGLWVQDEGSTLSVDRSSFVGGEVAEGKWHAAALTAAFDGTLSVTASSFFQNQGRAIWGRERGHVVLQDVSVTDVDPGPKGIVPAIHVLEGGTLEGTRVRLSGFQGTGIGATAAQLKLSWALIEDGAAYDDANAHPISSQDGSELDCDHCLLRALQGSGVTQVGDGGSGSAKLTDLVAAEMEPSADQRGNVIQVMDSRLTLARAALLDVPRYGVYGEDSEVELDDLRMTAPVSERPVNGVQTFGGGSSLSRVSVQGRSIVLQDGEYSLDEVSVTGWNGVREDTGIVMGVQLLGDGDVRRLHVADGYGAGVVFGRGYTATARDVVVEAIKPQLGDYPSAFGVINFGDMTGESWVVREISGMGILAQDGKLFVSDALVARTRSNLRGIYGVAAGLFAPSELTRVRIERSFGVGVGVLGTKATLSDLTIVDTRPGELSSSYGQGLYVSGAVVIADRVAITDAHEAGIQIESSEVTLRDVQVSDVYPSVFFESQGAGIWAVGEGLVTLERARFENVRTVGLGFSQGASLSATDLEVRRVELGRSLLLDAFGSQAADDVGDCLLLAEGSKAGVAGALFDGCARSGILLYRSEATLGSVEVRGAPVGLVTQYASLPDYDPGQLFLENVEVPHLDDPGYPVPAGPPVSQALSKGLEFGDLIGKEP